MVIAGYQTLTSSPELDSHGQLLRRGKHQQSSDFIKDEEIEKMPLNQVKLLPGMSRATFQQDVLAYLVHKTPKRYQSHFPEFWAKGEWPGKSLNNLPPTENLRTIAREETSEIAPPIPEGTLLAKNARTPRFEITSETLDNLLSGMLAPMMIRIREEGGYISE